MLKRHVALIFMIIFLLPLGLSAEDYIYFKLISVEKHGQKSIMLFPYRYHFDSSLSSNELVDGLFAEIKKNDQELYSHVKASYAHNIAQVTFTSKLNPDFLQVIGELYYSFTFNGIKKVIFKDVDGKPIRWKTLPYTVFLPYVDYTGAIKPLLFPEMIIHLDRKSLYFRSDYEKMKRRKKSLIPNLINQELIYGNSLIKLYLLKNFDDLPILNKKSALIRLLKDENKYIRMEAIDKLAYFHGSAVIHALEDVVNNDSVADVKTRAVIVLTKFGIKKYKIFILFTKLKSPNESVVQDTLDQLINSNDPKVVSGLLTVLNHKSAAIREEAAKGIIKFHDYSTMLKLLNDTKIAPSLREMFAVALLNSGIKKQWSAGLIHLLKYGSDESRIKAIAQVEKLGARQFGDALIATIKSDNDDVVKAAARVLGKLKIKKALAPLAGLAAKRKDLTPALSDSIIGIMASMGEREVMKLADSDKQVLRMFATKSLSEFLKKGSRHKRKIKKILIKRLGDKNLDIRRAAVYALAKSDEKSVLSRLVKLINDPDHVIKEQILIAMNRTGYPLDTKTIQEALNDPDDQVKLQALIAINKRHVKQALQKLMWMTKYGNVEIRRQVWLALASLMTKQEYKKNFNTFSDALYDQDKLIRITAIGVLAQIHDPRVAPTLSNLVTDPDIDIQKAALAGLSHTGDPAAVEFITQGLFDSKKTIKMATLEALKNLNIEEARKPVEEFLKNETDKQLRAKAEEALDSLP